MGREVWVVEPVGVGGSYWKGVLGKERGTKRREGFKDIP